MSPSVKPVIPDADADRLAAAFGRRGVMGAGIAGGLLATPLFAPVGVAHAQSAAPDAEITVDQARTAPIPIVIPSLGNGIGQQITDVISADLGNCGLFRPISASMPTGRPDFATYKTMGARAMVSGRAENTGSSIRVEFRLWDVTTGSQIQGTAYTASSQDWRRIAHVISDVIYTRLLGEKGYFNSRIAYVAMSGPRSHQTRRLAIMDQDGADSRYLTSGQWDTITPRFNPANSELAFMSYINNRPRVYLFNLNTGQQRMLGEFSGMSFAPRFSPRGDAVVLSVTRGSGSDLYSVDLSSMSRHQITASGAIDTSPCYSPDGSQIVFNSDRGGSPQLYVMPATGGDAKRISYGHGHYGSPVWSPRGDLIAFSRIANGSFSLGVMAPDGTGERILTQGFTVESPTFCPNGRVLAFCRQTAAHAGGAGFSSGISSIDITGFHERPLPVGSSSDPTWSPLNQ
ncbi:MULTISPECIES: Tol-Pal system beta propeller repeat protein TolB [Novacetimonas]|uniref:Tol-Pal system protein TolB n=2 Tax=Novacetimonas hansenii TaxID=436 RepID=A0AAW5ETL3_NOVHA|nr:Tol-Pal system beta propeller repeat protein TolB [Novacetimonas hansenii]EFG82909.1 translocation protein TolB [Novacetimonas hansenii ATCC 23769]MBL7235219.1 Tol-Pal system protein TolB [Novacetimonas hansenii]MCJ8355172.1 Tol-Pal system beta propeller repeat protein TolB [Novacetimonas hansenii]PYD73122.1 Tol-Pal system beta propeller repeat protein TolB [Novacetimonas hansenii]RFP00677.1 Tol-Pal system beta propeller repeat protein TolB [Novacetimonas hansenii]